MQGTDGSFYGTTETGGARSTSNCKFGCGTLFEITAAGAFEKLYTFCSQVNCADGANPSNAGLLQATDGNLYGTTMNGGAYSKGCSLACLPSGGTFFGWRVVVGMTLSPASQNFESTVINTAGVVRTVTVTNTGSVMLQISSINASANFAVSSTTCGPTLNVGKQCLVHVTFTPKVLGKVEGTLTFTDNAPDSPQTVTLVGTGVKPVALTPTSATYAARKVGTTSLEQTFVLVNNQTIALNDIVISTTGDFAVSSRTCTTSLAAKSKCTINVTFTPTATGTRTGQLTVRDSATNSPQTATLAGTGALPATLTPPSAAYGLQVVGTTSAPKAFTLTNNQTVAVNDIVISTSGDFAVSSRTCTTSLAAKSKCTINVTFTPTATGTRTGQLKVRDNAGNSPQTTNLTGTGK